jgi:hypothetical protein
MMTAATDTFVHRVRRAASLVDGPGLVGYWQCRRRIAAIETTAVLSFRLNSLSMSLRGETAS